MSKIPLTVSAIAPLHSPPNSSNLSEATKKGIIKVQPPQTAHRIAITEAWGGASAFEGQSVLELGCGQGDMSATLAAAVSPKGSVLAWDPASGDYGSPMTLAQAQQNIASQPQLSSILKFSLSTPLDSLLSPKSQQQYTHAILAHCLYYFASPDGLLSTFKTLAAHQPPIKYLCLAEYALKASVMEQVPHLLSVLTQSAVHEYQQQLKKQGIQIKDDQANVQTVLSPEAILKLAEEAGWALAKDDSGDERQCTITPAEELQDGSWEVGNVLDPYYLKGVLNDGAGAGSSESTNLEAFSAATISMAKSVKASGKKIRTMDVWCAVLTRKD